MSQKPLKFCRARNCNQTTRSRIGYCDEHIKLSFGFVKEKEKGNEYNTAAWRKYSRRFRDAARVCVGFMTCGGGAEVVDHIIPVEQGGAFWDEANHQAMCNGCHNRKRGEERWSSPRKGEKKARTNGENIK